MVSVSRYIFMYLLQYSVHLRDLVPQHIKAAFSMEMLRCGAEETGRAFLEYLLDALRVELRAQESNPRRGDGEKVAQQDKNKTEKVKTLGKLYSAKGKDRRRASSSSSTSESHSPKTGRKSTDTEGETQVYTGVVRPKNIEPPKCNCCGEGAHFLYNCYRFVHEYRVPQKRRFVEDDVGCFRCLRSGHIREGSRVPILKENQPSLPVVCKRRGKGRSKSGSSRRRRRSRAFTE